MSVQHLLDALTERELDIARLIADGLSNHEIAQKLVLTHGTVKWYCGQIYSKLGVNSRSHAVHSLQSLRLVEKPVVKGTASGKSRLPVPLSSLIGRRAEILAVRELLGANRLLTLTGPGGTGKTRLALAVAWEAATDFADGATFVDLASFYDAALVVKAIARAAGVMLENASESLLDTLKRALAGQERLLVIDNFEQVIESAPTISQLLASAPRVKILITSREALRVSGEQEYAVPPLRLPDIENASMGDMRQSEAVLLFQQRATMIRPDFALTDENIPIIAEICVRLDGLPLAIELAAARCKLLSPGAMLSRLDSRLNTLTGGSRDAPARQQTLRNTIEWSYNLLDDGEKMLFGRLGVFCGGRYLEAIEAVCADGLPIDVLNGLASLVDKNLVQQKEDATGEPRFVMLGTLFEFAEERLEVSSEAETLRRRHAEYYVALAERVEPELHLAHQQRWSQLLETQRDDLRMALEWSRQHDIALGLRLASALWWHWSTYGYHSEGYRRTQGLLPRMAGAPLVYHPKFLVAAGRMALLQSDLAGAKRLLEQALDTARQVGDQRQAAWSLILQCLTVINQPDQANALAGEGLALFRALDDKPGMASAFNTLGEIARVNGMDEQAKRNYEAVMALADQTGNIRRKYITLVNMSYILQHEGDHERAVTLLRQTLGLARQLKNYHDMALGVEVLSGSLGIVGDAEQAARLLGAAEAAQERIGAFIEPTNQPELDRNIACVRSLLDEATFRSAWAEGRKMTLEQAVAEALGE